MKTYLTFLVLMFNSAYCLAQFGFNYKAIINDSSGNPVASSLVVVQFSIIEGTPTGTLVYREDHTPTTDENGLIILNIGHGNASIGTFTDIEWLPANHYLNVQVNTGGGLADLGTTQFLAVPVAMEALRASNVLGLELVNENDQRGWRLVDRDPLNFGDIGVGALDFSESGLAGEVNGATGDRSFAFGSNTQASGNTSISIGNNNVASDANSVAIGTNITSSGLSSFASGASTVASGFVSTAMGFFNESSGSQSFTVGGNNVASGVNAIAMGANSTASGILAFAFGNNVEATGNTSIAIGTGLNAESSNVMAIGRYNLGGGNPDSWQSNDPLFEIGIGNSEGSRANAVTVLKNGNVGIGVSNPVNELQVDGVLQIGSIETIGDGGLNTLAAGASIRPTFDDNYRLGNSTFRWIDVWASDGTINTSDRRDKSNIESLEYGLTEIMKLKPVSFNWKSRPSEDKKLGLIAQELLTIIPEVVKTHDWEVNSEENNENQKVELDRLGVYYSDLIPVLIKAIQEQQHTINNQQVEIDNLKSLIQTSLDSKN